MDDASPPSDARGAPSFGDEGLLRLTGDPFSRGETHGRRMAAEIGQIVRLYAERADQPWARLPDVRGAFEAAHVLFDREAIEEMQGIAAGANVAWDDVLTHNLYLYSELMGAGCTQFAVTSAGNAGGESFHGANVDLPVRLQARELFEPVVAVVHPPGQTAYATALVPGCVGGIGGANAWGVGLSSALLLDQFDPAAPLAGQRHTVTARRILAEAEDLESAVDILRRQPKYGAWAVCLSHGAADRVCYAEYRGDELRLDSACQRVFGSNHALLFAPRVAPPAHSVHRRDRLRELLDSGGRITEAAARAALRDQFDPARGRNTRHPTMNTVRRVDNLLSMVWRPQQGVAQFVLTRGGTKDGGSPEECREIHVGALLDSSPRDSLSGVRP